jgi:hypothetical protein
MKKTAPPFVAESLAWIQEHPFATTHDLPQRLIDRWLLQNNQREPSEHQLAIFTFGVLQYHAMTQKPNPDGMLSMPAEDLMENFSKWQAKLAVSEIQLKTEMRFKALPHECPAVSCFMPIV